MSSQQTDWGAFKYYVILLEGRGVTKKTTKNVKEGGTKRSQRITITRGWLIKLLSRKDLYQVFLGVYLCQRWIVKFKGIMPLVLFMIFFLDFVTPKKRNRSEGCGLFTLTQTCMQEYASAGKVLSIFELLNCCTFCTKLWAFSPLPPFSYTFKALH